MITENWGYDELLAEKNRLLEENDELKGLQSAIDRLGRAIDQLYDHAEPLTLQYADSDSLVTESLAHIAEFLKLEPFQHGER